MSKEKEIDTWLTENLICPYCGYEEQDSWELGDSDNNFHCNSCDKRFSWDTEVSRTFTSRKVDCLNGAPHRFGEWDDYGPIFLRRCFECQTTERKPNVKPEPTKEGESKDVK